MNQFPDILVVDDNLQNLHLIEVLLKDMQLSIITANSGRDALIKAKNKDLAVALIDVQMPEMNGFDLAIQLNKNRGIERIPVIFLTAIYSNDEDVKKGYQSGGVDYIFKPINNYILQNKVAVFVDLFKNKNKILADSYLLKQYADQLYTLNIAKEESEKKYRNYINNAPDGILVTDLDGNIIEINQTLKTMLYYQKDSSKEDELSALFTKELCSSFLKDNSMMKKGLVLNKDYSLNGRNKNIKSLSIDSIKLSENRILSFVKDITQRKELEKSISEKKLLLEKQNEEIKHQNIELLKANAVAIEAMMLYDFSPSGYFTVNRQGKIIRLNLSAAKILNCDQNELKNNTLNRFLCEESVKIYQYFIDELHNCNEHKSCEIEIFLNDKKKKFLHLEGIRSKTDDLVLISAVDITNLKKSEEALRQSEANLAEAQQIAQIGSWEIDLNTGKMKCSDQMFKLFEIDKDHFDGNLQSLSLYIHPDDINKFNDGINFELNIKQSTQFEYRVLLKNGLVRYILACGKVKQTEEGRYPKFMGTVQDITDRKLAEKERIALSQLQQLTEYTEKAKEEERKAIARELHDDLGQSLTAVKIDLSIARSMCADNEINAKLLKISDIVSDTIKTVQKITSRLRPQLLDDLGIIATIEWFSEEFSKRNNIIVKHQFDDDIYLDNDSSLHLFRIIQESFTNIARHAKASIVFIELKKLDDYILLKIKDNGIGIAESQLKSAKSFGLIGMRERVAILNGQFKIAGKENKGSCIEITIPV